MSLESNVGKSVLDLGDLIKAGLVTEVARARADGRLSLSEGEFRLLVSLLNSTVDTTVSKGVDGVLRNLK